MAGSELFIALGSNIGEREKNIREALQLIEKRVGAVRKVSSLYETLPLSIPDGSNVQQPDFINCVALVFCELEPELILQRLLSIEGELGRDRAKGRFWGPRIIDLDIIAYGDRVFLGDTLAIPHPRFRERDFVLYPLRELAPNFYDPQSGLSITELVSQYESSGGEKTLLAMNSKEALDDARPHRKESA